MRKDCSNCHLVNRPDAKTCVRCDHSLNGPPTSAPRRRTGRGIPARIAVCVTVCAGLVIAFYVSLVFSARPLSIDQKYQVRQAIRLLRDKGFGREAMLLDNFTVYRSDDNWLNASVAKETAYAATNFPFQIMTLYPDFFTYPVDDVERAAILLHEAKHLEGWNEAEAYEFVWRSRQTLGWTRDGYAHSPVWQNVRIQTRNEAPLLFICVQKDFGDCTA